MKNYNPKFIYDFIEDNKEIIEKVECGMREDWSYTSEIVFDEDGYNYNLHKETVRIAGICGSGWATPVMRVTYNDGTRDIIECWKGKEENLSEEAIERKKMFCFMTGGLDEVEV